MGTQGPGPQTLRGPLVSGKRATLGLLGVSLQPTGISTFPTAKVGDEPISGVRFRGRLHRLGVRFRFRHGAGLIGIEVAAFEAGRRFATRSEHFIFGYRTDALRGEEGAEAEFADPRYAHTRTDGWQHERAQALAEALRSRGVTVWAGELPPPVYPQTPPSAWAAAR